MDCSCVGTQHGTCDDDDDNDNEDNATAAAADNNNLEGGDECYETDKHEYC